MSATTVNSDNTMNDGGYDSPFGRVLPDDASDMADMPEVDVDAAVRVDEPDASIAEPKQRSPKAKQYEKKTSGLFKFLFHVTVRNERTQPDAATILMYGPDISQAVGDLAAENPWAARAVDMLTDTTDNAAAALMMAAVPFALQILRNHEPTVESVPKRKLRIPFTQRSIALRLRFKLKRARKYTYPPEQMHNYVFTNPAVFEKLAKQGIHVKQR